jgi:hypothetical protein
MSPRKTRSHTYKEKNLYITMYDTSQHFSDDDSTNDISVHCELRNRIVEIEEERDKLRSEIIQSKNDLITKSSEMQSLKNKIFILEKQNIKLTNLVKRNSSLEVDLLQKKLCAMKDEVERWRSEMRKLIDSHTETVESYKVNHCIIQRKLEEAENCKQSLRSAYDYIYERLEARGTRAVDEGTLSRRRSGREAAENVKMLNQTNIRKKTKSSNVKQPRVFIVGDDTARGLGPRLQSRVKNGVECVTRPGSRLENTVADVSSTVNKASLGDTVILLSGKNESYKHPQKYFKHLESIIELATQRNITLYINSIKYVKNSKVNLLIYRINCKIYHMTSSSNNVHIIETNAENTLCEQISMLLNYTAHKIPICVAINTTTVDSCKENLSHLVGSPVAGTSYVRTVGSSSFSGRGHPPPWP